MTSGRWTTCGPVQPYMLQRAKRRLVRLSAWDINPGRTLILTSVVRQNRARESVYIWRSGHVYFLRGCLLADHTERRSSSRIKVILLYAGGGSLHNGATRRMHWATPTHSLRTGELVRICLLTAWRKRPRKHMSISLDEIRLQQ